MLFARRVTAPLELLRASTRQIASGAIESSGPRINGFPLLLDGHVLGVLSLFGSAPLRFGAQELALLEALVTQASLAMGPMSFGGDTLPGRFAHGCPRQRPFPKWRWVDVALSLTLPCHWFVCVHRA